MGLLESACDSVVAVQDVVESLAWESDVCPTTPPGAERYAERHAERYSGSDQSANRNQRRARTASRRSFLPAIFAVRISIILPLPEFNVQQGAPGSRWFCENREWLLVLRPSYVSGTFVVVIFAHASQMWSSPRSRNSSETRGTRH